MEQAIKTALTSLKQPSLQDLKYGTALIVILCGLGTIVYIVHDTPVNTPWTPTNVIAVVGSITTFLGTIVGALLGVQIGAVGKEKTQDQLDSALDDKSKTQGMLNDALAAKDKVQQTLNFALAKLSPDDATEAINQVNKS